MFSKKQIVKAIAELGKKLGRVPSRRQFLSQGGINEYRVGQCFPTWSHAVKAAGFQPYRFNTKVEDRALLEDWGKAVRRNGRIPTHLGFRREGKYDPNTIGQRFGRWSLVPEAFRRFAKGKREWKDVLALLPPCGPAPAPKKKTNTEVTKRESTEPAEKRRRREDASSPILKGSILRGQTRNAALRDRPIYGTPTQFPWLRYEPVNEHGVVLLFGMLAKQLGYMIETVQTGFPDCEALRQIGPERWQRVRIEFEFESRNFRDHGHPLTGCDVIVCWRHNWEGCPTHIEVVELSRVIKSLAGWDI